LPPATASACWRLPATAKPPDLANGFQRWQTIRVTFQVTALAAVLAALAVAVTS
jgi:hypothetical protein